MSNFQLPDGPKTPTWLQQIEFILDPITYLKRSYQKYGDIFNAPVIGNFEELLLVSDPQGLQKLLTRDTKEFFTPIYWRDNIRLMNFFHLAVALDAVLAKLWQCLK